MDVARFKYSAHWVSLDTVWHAMQAIEQATGKVSCLLCNTTLIVLLCFSADFRMFNTYVLCVMLDTSTELCRLAALQQRQHYICCPLCIPLMNSNHSFSSLSFM
jgi:predicted exporter